eukprot:TRINITY_DN12658_c0_g1_i8.p1 TRINITY_DN12658_c0_g1~~TRINITY_DN12658_c0_g1_i8.p1  ORF type:complete len:815 (-),score=130.99 TRINITY_DN12658_c0_g1_i8:80-2524(-)
MCAQGGLIACLLACSLACLFARLLSMATIIGCILLTFVFWLGAAFPSYRYHVPNGLRVACPPGVGGCRTGDTSLGEPFSVCDGLGHATCAGADFPLNPFGKALKDADFKWTQALCNADSDGDGFSNGEELGDPCCSWKEGDGPSPYMSAMNATHPGFSSASFPSEYSKPACTAATQPEYKSPGMAAFNPGEEQRYVDFIIKNYSIPEKRTDYSDFVFNFDDADHSIYHIVYGIALVDQPKLLHHFVVTGCTEKIDPALQGTRLPDGQPGFCNEPIGGFAGWAPGATLWDMPTNAGVPIGTGNKIVGFNINVHYTDGDIHKGSISQDGIRIYYTPTLRNTTVDSVSIMQIGRHGEMAIPPKRERYFVTRTCKVQAEKELPIVATFYHAHLLGVAMYQTLTRNNQTWDLGSQSRWHYDDQAIFPMMAAKMTVQDGDLIQGTCIYNSMGRDTSTPMGLNTVDEMCFTQVNVERPTNEEGAFFCLGDIWSGDLGSDDDPRKIAQLHPLANATDKWYGTDDGFALGRVGENGGECQLCDDPSSFQPDTIALQDTGRGNFTCKDITRYVEKGIVSCSDVESLASICCSQTCKLCDGPGQKLNESKIGGQVGGDDYTCKEAYDWYVETGGVDAGGCDNAKRLHAHCCERGQDEEGGETWTTAQCKTNLMGMFSTCPKTSALAGCLPLNTCTPDQLKPALSEICMANTPCRMLVDTLEANCAHAQGAEVAFAMLHTVESYCNDAETDDKNDDITTSTVPAPASVSSSARGAARSQSESQNSSTTSAMPKQVESQTADADGSVRRALVGGAAFAFAAYTLLVA